MNTLRSLRSRASDYLRTLNGLNRRPQSTDSFDPSKSSAGAADNIIKVDDPVVVVGGHYYPTWHAVIKRLIVPYVDLRYILTVFDC